MDKYKKGTTINLRFLSLKSLRPTPGTNYFIPFYFRYKLIECYFEKREFLFHIFIAYIMLKTVKLNKAITSDIAR